jgi:hypothetical protein
MATRLKWEIRSVIRLSHAEHVSAAESHRQIIEVYGEEVTSRQSVAEGCSDFKLWRKGVQTSNCGGRLFRLQIVAEGCSDFKVWRKGVQTSNPVELEQWIMRDVADRQNLAALQVDNF